MCCQKLSHSLIKITVVLLFLVGCSAPAATPVPPTAIPPTPTPVPLTSTPPVINPIAEMLIGTWQPLSDNPDAMFLQFNSDGTCRHAYSLDHLKNTPEIECTYTFEGTNLLITAVKLNGVPECPSATGKYEVLSIADNQIQLVSIKDTCARRIRSTQYKYQRIP